MLTSRLISRLRRDGICPTLAHAARRMVGAVSPTARRTRREQLAAEQEFLRKLRAADEAFDAKYGTDTGGLVELDGLNVVGGNRAQGTRCQAVFPERFTAAIMALPIDLSRFTYIDLGSGKGRSVLLASRYPFWRIIGVEFSKELHNIAMANSAIYSAHGHGRCVYRDFICGDAAEFKFPATPLVIFLHNPFGAAVMQRVADNLMASPRANPREAYVVYIAPAHGDIWDRAGGQVVWESEFGKAWRFLVR